MNIPVRFGPTCPPWPPAEHLSKHCPPAPPPCPPASSSGVVLLSAVPPANPCPGVLWWDGITLRLFDGVSWVSLGLGAGSGGGAAVGTTPPQNPSVGTLWWNGTVFQVWDGTQWKPVMGQTPGVTDGSNAAPGFVGEFLNYSGGVSFNAGSPGNVVTTNATLTTLTVPPGDWNIWAFAEADVYVTTIEIRVSPLPAGMSNDLLCFNSVEGATTPLISAGVASPAARGSFTVSTVLTLVVQIQTQSVAGTASVFLHARRVR